MTQRTGESRHSPLALTIERLSSSWLLRCLDVALLVLIVTGIVVDPLALSHGIAVVLVIQAFLLDWRAASLRVVLTAVLTTAGALTHSAPLRDIAIQVPFVYGLAALVVLLSDPLRRSRGAAERLALYDTIARPMPAGDVDAYLRREAVPVLAM